MINKCMSLKTRKTDDGDIIAGEGKKKKSNHNINLRPNNCSSTYSFQTASLLASQIK